MDQKRLAVLLRKLNKSAITPFGKIPLERLVAKNLDDLSSLRLSGITWPSISRALVDWRRDNNRPLSVDQLRSAYSRARRHRDSKIALMPLAVAKPEPHDPEHSSPASRVPLTETSVKENLKTASQQPRLRERLSRTLSLRNIKED